MSAVSANRNTSGICSPTARSSSRTRSRPVTECYVDTRRGRSAFGWPLFAACAAWGATGRHRWRSSVRRRRAPSRCTAGYSDLDHACESAILLPPETPRKCRPLNPHPLASSQEFGRLIDAAMRLPRHVLGDRCIACVLIEDHLRILDHSRLGEKPRRLPRTLRSWHALELVSG